MRTSDYRLQWNREKKKHTKKTITPDLGKYAQDSFW